VNIWGGKNISLRHDETPLTGIGIISLGREVDLNLSGEILLIYFEMRKPAS